MVCCSFPLQPALYCPFTSLILCLINALTAYTVPRVYNRKSQEATVQLHSALSSPKTFSMLPTTMHGEQGPEDLYTYTK